MNSELLPPENAKLSFAELNSQVHDEIGKWAEETVVNGWRRLVPYFRDMHELLSPQGKCYNKNDNLPTWTEWYLNLQISVNQAFTGAVSKLNLPLPSDMPELPSLRMVQIELKRLTDGTAPAAAGAPTRVHKGGRPKRSSTKTKKPTAKPTPASAAPATDSDSAGARLAEEGILISAPSVAEPEKVAAAPDELDPSVSKLNAEPDWKQVLVELMAVLEQFGDRLPLAVLSRKRTIEKLLEGKDLPLAARAVSQHPAKRYQKPERRTPKAMAAGL